MSFPLGTQVPSGDYGGSLQPSRLYTVSYDVPAGPGSHSGRPFDSDAAHLIWSPEELPALRDDLVAA